MQVQFPHSETQKKHTVKVSVGDYYILDHHPMNWSTDCFIAVPKSAVTVVDEVTYSAGQRFTLGATIGVQILASINVNEMSLINLDTGNRWKSPPVKVNDSSKITEKEMAVIAAGRSYKLAY